MVLCTFIGQGRKALDCVTARSLMHANTTKEHA